MIIFKLFMITLMSTFSRNCVMDRKYNTRNQLLLKGMTKKFIRKTTYLENKLVRKFRKVLESPQRKESCKKCSILI